MYYPKPMRTLIGAFALTVGTTVLGITSVSAATTCNKTPGHGTVVTPAVLTYATALPVSWVYSSLLEKLGYNVKNPVRLQNAIAFKSLAKGDTDFVPLWVPLHTAQFPKDFDDKATILTPQCAQCGIQGYVVDKASAEKYHITSLTDFRRKEVREAFDHDGDGKAELYGSPIGWASRDKTIEILKDHDLAQYIEPVKTSYPIGFTQARTQIQKGEPALYYTWAPSGYILDLVPGKDVVWINAPGKKGRATGIKGAVTDPIYFGLVPNDLTVAANNKFLDANPAAKVLLDRVRLPLTWLSEMGKRINNQNLDADELKQAALKWIDNNSDDTNKWLNAAIEAACAKNQ